MLLVTGAPGHSGQWFIRKLVSEHYQKTIRCLVRPSSDIRFLKTSGLNIEFVKGDLNDADFINNALQDIETVVHFAGIVHSKRVIHACKINNVDWAILVHTTGRYSKYRSASKEYIEIEDLVFSSGVSHTIVRPTMIYGGSKDRNMWKLVDFLYRHKFFPVFGTGNNLMQPVHARDVGEAVYSVFDKKLVTVNKAYNIAGKTPLSYNEVLKTVASALDRKVTFIHIPYSISCLLTQAYNFISANAAISTEQVMRMNEDKDFDYSKASRDFGYSPVAFKEGIASEVKEYLKVI